MSQTYTISPDEAGQRLDVWCVGTLPDHTRSVIQRAIKQGMVTINDHTVKPNRLVRAGDRITIELIKPAPTLPIAQQAMPDIPILFENKEIVVIAKPAGIATHPGSGVTTPTISDWFVSQYPKTAHVGEGDVIRPGIVHRLDKDTSGVMILAKDQETFDYLKQQFKDRRVKKEYLALIFGIPGESSGRIVRALVRSKRNPMRRTVATEQTPVRRGQRFTGEKPAITEWQKERTMTDPTTGRTYSLLRVLPFTGRTHQIRVHLHWLGFPIVGDQLYTFKRQRPPQGATRQLLHAEKLTIALPITNEQKTFSAPVPPDFQAILDQLQ